MSNRYVNIDMSEFKDFFQKMERAARGDFRRELNKFLEGLGDEFLRIVQDEFINRNKNTGHAQLVESFVKDGRDNVWRYSDDWLTLEVGTSVKYASYVNDGHQTFDTSKTKYFILPNGEKARFVPGRWHGGTFIPEHKEGNETIRAHWEGGRFEYDKTADGGMVLKYHWVEGLHFWEAALHAMESICPEILERKLQEWLDNYFGG